MASNITLSYFGPPEQKHVIKVPPMQTLSETLQAAASKFKPALVASQCILQYNKKPVDLNTPFRLLNVPAGSRLEIIKARGSSQQGPAAAPEAPTSTQHATAVAPAAVAPGQPAAVTSHAQAAPDQQAHTAPTAQTPQQQQQQHAAPAAAVDAMHAQPKAVSFGATAGHGAGADAGPSSSGAAAAAHVAAGAGPSRVQEGSSSGTAAAAAAPGPLASLGIQGQVYVFHQRTLEAAAAAAPKPMDVDPPDDFFELTTDDLIRMQQQANEKKKQDVMFKSHAMREAEAAALAASLGPVRVRLHFPDATIVQATFESSQPLSAVQQLVTQLSVQALGPALYLYTTPPKTVLKDLTATLYQLKLVPAAHLYVGCDVKKLKGPAAAEAAAGGSYPGPFLCPEVIALMSDSLPDQVSGQQQQQQHAEPVAAPKADAVSAAEAQRLLVAAAAASRSEDGGSSRAAAAGGGGKAPKWLKMGK